MRFRSYTQLIVESVVPDLFHVVPIRHDPMLDWIFQSQNTSLALCLVANIAVFLVHSNHDAWHLGTAYDRREHGTRRIVSCETSLAHTTAIVDDKCCNLFFAHSLLTAASFNCTARCCAIAIK